MIEIADATYKGFWDKELSNDEYHGDKSAVSSTGLRKALKSAATFHTHHILGKSEEPTDPMRFGTLAHMAIIEGKKFRDRYKLIPDFGPMQSSTNRAKKKAWMVDQPPGSVLCTEEELEHLMGMIDAVIKCKDAFRILKDVTTEVSGYYRDPETGIKCRIRPDALGNNLGVLADVKTTTDLTLHEFSKTIWDLRYDVQMAMYCEGAEIISGRKIEYPVFIAIEKKPPYEVAVYVADNTVMEIGASDYHRALRVVKNAIDSGKWEGYQTSLQNIGLPHWVIQNRKYE